MLSNAVRQAARLQQRRTLATNAAAGNVVYGKSFKSAWLSDKGAWPVFGVISAALVLCGGFISNKLMFHPDIRITADKRKSDIRTWS